MSTKTRPPYQSIVMPSTHVYDKKFVYRPSWTHVLRTTWVARLGGHYGVVGERLASTH